MNGCEGKADCTAEEVKAKAKATPGIGDLLGILGALGCITEADQPVNTLDIEDFVNEFDCKFGSTPDNLKFFVMPMEDFEKFWSRARIEVRASIVDKYVKLKVPDYTEQDALHAAFSNARKLKMDAFIAQHGCKVFNTYDAWQKLGFQVRQGETGQKVYFEPNMVVIFGVNQTVAKVPSVRISDVTLAITQFCQDNGIWGVAKFKEAYPWTEKYFMVHPKHVNIRETGETF